MFMVLSFASKIDIYSKKNYDKMSILWLPFLPHPAAPQPSLQGLILPQQPFSDEVSNIEGHLPLEVL